VKPAGVGRPDEPLDHITPYDRFCWSDTEVEHLLETGAHEHDLVAYFGEAEYRDLRQLARKAAGVTAAPEPVVLVIPGIMGSQLGLRRAAPLPHDVVWLDPIDIEVGRLAALRIPGPPVISLGTVLYSYLRLKLHLRAAGFRTAFHDYDWRLGIDALGRELAERIRTQSAHSLVIVAHSMGGLVSRAALALPGTAGVARLVLLGTPNFGSFAPVQALRGTYAVVRKIARLVKTSSAETLAAEVFNTFPSLYQMLPDAARHGGPDLLEQDCWPRTGPHPREGLLRSARSFVQTLAPADQRFACIVGIGEETVTAVSRRRDEFEYTITRHGDGTVPAISAELPGATTYYARVAHSDLTRDAVVASAVVDLLRRGATRRLNTRRSGRSAASARITDTQLRRTHVEKVDWAKLPPQERCLFLQNLNEPPKLRLRVPKGRTGRR